MNKKNVHIGKILFLGGAYCALSAGSGFGTGQELTQYFVVHGPGSLIGLWVTQVITFIFGCMLIIDTRKYGLKTLDAVYAHYCGKVVGKILWIFNIAYLLAMCATMIAGAGANVAQYFGVSDQIGRIVMAIAVLITCLFGFKKLLNINGILGPIIMVFVILIAILALVNPTDGIAAGAKFLQETTHLSISSNFAWSCFLYTTMCIFFQMPYWHACAANDGETTEDTVGSCIIGAIFFISVQTISTLSMISNASILDGVQVPNLALAQHMGMAIAGVFGLILMFAIYTTTLPEVFALTNTFAKEGSKNYKTAIVFVVIIGFVISQVGAFDQILNVVFTVCGWVAILYAFPFLYTRFIRKPQVPAQVPELPYYELMRKKKETTAHKE